MSLYNFVSSQAKSWSLLLLTYYLLSSLSQASHWPVLDCYQGFNLDKQSFETAQQPADRVHNKGISGCRLLKLESGTTLIGRSLTSLVPRPHLLLSGTSPQLCLEPVHLFHMIKWVPPFLHKNWMMGWPDYMHIVHACVLHSSANSSAL